MNKNGFSAASLFWLFVAALIALLAYSQFRTGGMHRISDIIFSIVGIIAAVWLLSLLIRFLAVCFQNNFILTLFVLLSLLYLTVQYKIFSGNPYIGGYIQKIQEFRDDYNNKMDRLDMMLNKGTATPESGPGIKGETLGR